MIEIKVNDIDKQPPHVLRNVAGMFIALADYAEQLSGQIPQPQAQEVFTTDAPATPTPSAAPSAPMAPPPAGIEVDTAGYPWDGRIHSSSRAKVANGTWRQKRNLDPALLAKVEAELRQVMGIATPIPTAPVAKETPTPPFVTTAVIPVAAASGSPVITETPTPPFVDTAVAPAPPASGAPVAPPAPTPAGSATSATTSPSSNQQFIGLMNAITSRYQAQTITHDMINAACAKAGIPSLPLLQQRPDLIKVVADELGITL